MWQSVAAHRFWARQLADRGLIGVVLSQSPEYVSPHGSSQPLFGTNPIAVRSRSRTYTSVNYPLSNINPSASAVSPDPAQCCTMLTPLLQAGLVRCMYRATYLHDVLFSVDH